MQDDYSENLEFFKWLFDNDNISLESTTDLTLCPNYEDSNIYYPKELGDFFRTLPMKRISRILQLSKFIELDKYTYHTRFEHCMGTYDKKKRIILNLYKDENFRKYIEDNNLKEYLIAELIKSAGHDIGHLPLSHVLEISVINKIEFHEVMGRRILLENKEIREVLDSISPTLHQALKTTLTSDVFGLDLIDEGNYDIDRFDYLIRDLFYRGQKTSLKFEPFRLSRLDINGETKTIPVFDINSVSEIEKFLKLREKAYKECYFNPITQIHDTSIAITLNELMRQKSQYGLDLQHFLTTLRTSSDPYAIDLDEYLTWDDLKFYNSLLDVAEFSDNKSLSQLSTFVLPNLDSFMHMTYSMLDLKNKKYQDLPEKDQELVHRIHKLICSNDEFAKNLRNPNYFTNIVRYTMDTDKINLLKKDPSKSKNIIFNSQTLLPYKSTEPIYIKNTDGKIYPIDKLPGRKFDISSSPEQIEVAFSLLPLLQESEIETPFDNQIDPNVYFEHTRKPNMNPLQTGNKIESYFIEH